MKKLLSTIMALVMLLSLVPMAVAEEGEGKWSETKTENSVAQVGNTYYEVLYDAVAAVEENGTVTLLKNATGGGVGTYTTAGKDNLGRDKIVAKSFILDFAGYTYTVSEPAVGSKGYESQGFHLEQGDGNVSVTLKNGTLASIGSAVKMLVQNYCNLTLDNMTLEGTGYVGKYFSNGDYVLSNNCGNVTIKDTTIVARDGDFAFDVYGGFQEYSDVTVTVTGNSVINGKVELARDNTANKNKNKLVIDGGTINGQICNTSGTVVVNGGAFTDLASAVKYATNGATITLAGDTTADRINLEDKSITVDLNGHTLTSAADYGVMFCAKNGKTITVNGTTPGSKLVGTVMVTAKTDGHIVLNGGTYESDKYVPVYINGDVNTENSTVKIKDAIITAIGTNSEQDMGCGVYLAGYATSTIENTKITAPVTGIEIRAGKLDLTNCTVTGGNGKVTEVANGNGTTVTNAAVAVSQHTTKKNIDVTIKGGEYTATAALYQTDVQGMGSQGVKATVLSGMFTGEVKAATEGAITIKGGAFTVNPSAFVTDETLVVVPSTDGTFTVKPKTSQEGNATITTEVSEDGKTVTETKTDGNTVTKTETNVDTGVKTETKTENKVEGNVKTKTETVTEKNAAGVTTKATETVTTEKTENGGKTTVVTEKDTLNKTETTEVTGVTAPTTASDVTLDVKNTTNVAVNKASMAALTGDTVKDVVIETKDATLTLNKTAVKTMENNVAANGKMTLDVTVTENTAKEVTVKVEAKTQGDKNVFPPETKNTNGEIEITIPYTGTADYLDLWYVTNTSTYMGRFPVVNGYVSFKVTHFSQYNLIPVASSGSSVIKTGAGSSAASGTHTVTTDLTPGSITKVTVDGKVVDAKYYTVSGSNVTFTAEFLKTLKNGSHTVTVENATKIAKGVFTVNNPTTAQSPTTADAGIALYAGMAIASVMGTGVVFTSRKRKNH